MAVTKRPLPKKIFIGSFSYHRDFERIPVGTGSVEKNSIGQVMLNEFLIMQKPFVEFTVQEIIEQLEANVQNRIMNPVSVRNYLRLFEKLLEGKIASSESFFYRGINKKYWLTKPIMLFIANFEEEN